MTTTMTPRLNGYELNGHDLPHLAPSKAKVAKPSKPWTLRQRLAVLIGGIASIVLALSLWHCTESLAMLTGSPWYLAFMLAFGIDAGMVGCELVAGLIDGKESQRWAKRYIWAAVGLSAVLNGIGSSMHVQGLFQPVAASVGALIPLLVYGLGRVAVAVWRGK